MLKSELSVVILLLVWTMATIVGWLARMHSALEQPDWWYAGDGDLTGPRCK